MQLGQIISRWRKWEERDVRQVAVEIGISPSALRNLENGNMPSGETLIAVWQWLLKAEPAAATATATAAAPAPDDAE
ncbi:MAG: helix-turn-helix transcriptional regulator [bacterium]